MGEGGAGRRGGENELVEAQTQRRFSTHAERSEESSDHTEERVKRE